MLVAAIAQYLQVQSLGTVDTNIYYEYLPPSPDLITAIFSNGGDSSSSKLPMDNPSIQIRVRGLTVSAAYNRIAAIYNVLQGLRNVALNDGTQVISCQAVQSAPINIGKDEQNRFEYTQTYDLIIRHVTNNRD